MQPTLPAISGKCATVKNTDINAIIDSFRRAVIGKPRSGMEHLIRNDMTHGISLYPGYGEPFIFWGLRPFQMMDAFCALTSACDKDGLPLPLTYRVDEYPTGSLLYTPLLHHEMDEALEYGVKLDHASGTHYILCIPENVSYAITSFLTGEGAQRIQKLPSLENPPIAARKPLALDRILA